MQYIQEVFDWYARAKTTEEYVDKTLTELMKLGPRTCMHYGRNHLTTSSKVNKAPPYLLTILWMLRYCIHDVTSHQQFINFLKPDRFLNSNNLGESAILTVDFFQDYIVTPITDIVHGYVETVEKNSTVKL
jgi:hypothetical protein